MVNSSFESTLQNVRHKRGTDFGPERDHSPVVTYLRVPVVLASARREIEALKFNTSLCDSSVVQQWVSAQTANNLPENIDEYWTTFKNALISRDKEIAGHALKGS